MFKSEQPLTVLQVGTINKPISAANGYGPIETVIFNIDRGLHSLGHRSIVACSADSAVTGERYETVGQSLGDYCQAGTPEAQMQVDRHLALTLARAQRGDVDVIHMHEWFESVYSGRFDPHVPIVMTLHVPGDRSGMAEFRVLHPASFIGSRGAMSAVAISEYQRLQYADLIPVARTIPHGLDVEDYLFKAEPNTGTYLFSIGRLTEDKGQDIAIEVAKRSGAKLIIAGCVQNKEADRAFFARLSPSFDLVVDLGERRVTQSYYRDVMLPILSTDKQVIFLGELKAEAAKQWYRHAEATLFTVRWGEPFGMVLIESMASGTPVIAFGKGSVREIVRDGKTGFIVDSVEEMVAAVRRLSQLDRSASFQHVQTYYSADRMAAAYASLYREVVDGVSRSRQAHADVASSRTAVLTQMA